MGDFGHFSLVRRKVVWNPNMYLLLGRLLKPRLKPKSKYLLASWITASFFICVSLVQSICVSFRVCKSEHIKNRLDRKKVLHHTRNVFPPGPSQWTKKLLKCIFLIEGADILYTAIDFHCCFFILLFSKIDSCKNVSWRQVRPYTVHYTQYVRPSIQDMRQLLSSQDTLICKRATHALVFSFYYLWFSHTNAL